MTFTLRGYQDDAVEAVLREWAGGRSTIICLCTGSGKTEIYLESLRREKVEDRLVRALIVAHREELITQPYERIHSRFPELMPVGVVKASRDEADRPTVIASIQTLKNPGRLERILQHGPITHMVIDEAHHSNAQSYRELLDRLRAANPGIKILGATATPRGGSGKYDLNQVYETTAFKLPLHEAIKLGAVVPWKSERVDLSVSFRGVEKVAGEYRKDAAGLVMTDPRVFGRGGRRVAEEGRWQAYPSVRVHGRAGRGVGGGVRGGGGQGGVRPRRHGPGAQAIRP